MAIAINQIKYDGIEYAIAHSAYAECADAAATQAKVANLVTDGDTSNNGFTLIKGVTVNVKFTNTNTAASPTLNVQGSGAKSIFYKGAAVPTSFLQSGRTYTLTYDGTNWTVVGDITAVTNSGPTLAWGTTSTIGTVDGVELKVTMPANPNTDTDTHYTTGLYVGASGAKSNAATSNGATYLKLYDNSTSRASFLIKGTGATTVSSDANGNITINSTDTNTNTDTLVTQAYSTTSSSYPLLMSATAGVSSTSSRGAVTAIVNNQLYANPSTGQLTAATFYATSDKRLKENIVEYAPTKTILDLPVYKYNFISDSTKKIHIGCLAQDLQEICPELVSTNENGYLSINESKIVYLLLDEVKKLKAELDELKAKA